MEFSDVTDDRSAGSGSERRVQTVDVEGEIGGRGPDDLADHLCAMLYKLSRG